LPSPWGTNGTSTGSVTTAYSAQTTTVTDQANNQRASSVDGLGRLASVIEFPGSGSYSTSYSYDVLGNLTGVSQSGLTRTFLYDSQKRLIGSTNPENYSTGNPPRAKLHKRSLRQLLLL
jgi:YD repeat-containing protein